ncbi:MAG: Ig-like domain-containing protein [Candidatus Krumholzibacteria bacterium]|nr:Ig-like domain-containing protein [Candidatus Krumholzibacteria bacterium]
MIRPAAALCRLFLLSIILPISVVEAQTPGMLGLYVDEARSSNEAATPGLFTGWVFCLPGGNGMMCAEFMVKVPDGMILFNTTGNPDISVALGSLTDGMSVCFTECRDDWVWTHNFSVFASTATPAEITIERHPSTQERMIANCLTGYPLEDVLVSSKICVNQPCLPDTVPPYPTGMTTTDGVRFHLEFSEEVFRPDINTEANYLVYPAGDPGSPISVLSAVIDSDGYAAVDLRLAAPTAENTAYILVLNNIRDIAGNAIAGGTELIFSGLDDNPPDLAGAAALDDSTAIAIFSERISAISAENPAAYTIIPGPAEGKTPVISAELSSSGDTVVLGLGAMLAQNTTYSLTVSGMTDIAGNPIDFAGPVQFMAIDRTPPHVTAAEAIDQLTASVVFNEAVTTGSAENPLNYSIYRADAPESLLAVQWAEAEGPAEVTLHLANPLEFFVEYFINISGIMDTAGLAIEPPGETLPLMLEDWSHPSLVSASAPDDSTISLVFSEEMDTTTTGDETAYSVFRTGDASDTIHVTDASPGADLFSVVLSLASPMQIGVYYTVKAAGVTDPAGNPITSADNAQVIIPDTRAPWIVSVSLKSMSYLELCFSETLDPATAANEGNYEIVRNGYPGEVFDIAGASLIMGGRCVLLAFEPALIDGGEYTLFASGIADTAGNIIPAGSSIAFTADDVWPPVVTGLSATTPQSIGIDFNEALSAETAEDAGNYALRERDNPGSTIAVSAAVLNGRNVALALASTMKNWVPYMLTITGVEDLAGNSIAEGAGFPVICVSGGPEAYITPYLDLHRTETYISPDIYTFFDCYVWCLPSERGAICGEFALENVNSTPDFSCVAMEETPNPDLVSVILGNIREGMSVCFNNCVYDWAWMVKARYLYMSGRGSIRVIPDPAVADILTANCLEGYPTETAYTGSYIDVNMEYIATLLSGFDAAFDDGAVVISWALGTGSEVPAFAVNRAGEGGEPFEEIADAGIARDGMKFIFTDRDYIPGGSYRYRVDYFDGGERRVLFETEPVETPPLPLSLAQNRPNPFNPSTEISFSLPRGGHAAVEIFDVNGRRVAVLCDRVFGQGSHTVVWDGRGADGAAMSSGVYFYRLTAGRERISRKMVLLK